MSADGHSGVVSQRRNGFWHPSCSCGWEYRTSGTGRVFAVEKVAVGYVVTHLANMKKRGEAVNGVRVDGLRARVTR